MVAGRGDHVQVEQAVLVVVKPACRAIRACVVQAELLGHLQQLPAVVAKQPAGAGGRADQQIAGAVQVVVGPQGKARANDVQQAGGFRDVEERAVSLVFEQADEALGIHGRGVEQAVSAQVGPGEDRFGGERLRG